MENNGESIQTISYLIIKLERYIVNNFYVNFYVNFMLVVIYLQFVAFNTINIDIILDIENVEYYKIAYLDPPKAKYIKGLVLISANLYNT